MNNIPKKNIYKVPEGYFEGLPTRILLAKKKKERQIYLSGMVAAAILVIGFLVFVSRPVEEQDYFQTNVNEEVEFYINTGIWGDEDILLLAENPNEILDQIAMEEWQEMNYDAEELINYEILY